MTVVLAMKKTLTSLKHKVVRGSKYVILKDVYSAGRCCLMMQPCQQNLDVGEMSCSWSINTPDWLETIQLYAVYHVTEKNNFKGILDMHVAQQHTYNCDLQKGSYTQI